MNKYNEKQLEILNRINNISDMINQERNWIEIAFKYCDYDDEDEDLVFKLALILNIIVEENSKLSFYTEKFISDLKDLIWIHNKKDDLLKDRLFYYILF